MRSKRACLLGLALGLTFLSVLDDVSAEEIVSDPKAAAEAFDEGEALREENKWSLAAKSYWSAIEADVHHYRAHVRYQDASLAGDSTVADVVDEYDALVSDYPEVKALRLHRLRLDPPTKRLEALAAALGANPQDYNAMLEVGRARLALGEGDEAVRALNKAMGIAPSDRVDVLLLLAEAEASADKADAARKRLASAVDANPQFWLGHLALARLDLKEGLFAEARGRAETVLAQRPSYVGAFLLRSEALVGEGDVKQALGVLHSAKRITPESPAVLVAIADLTAHEGTEKALKAALPIYEQVLAANEEHVHALYGAAWAHERLKAYDKAEEKYRQVASLSPKSAEAIDSVGVCLLKQGRVSEAQVQFRRAIDLNETFVTAWNNLGATLDAQSKYQDAIKIYEKILKMKGQKENLRALINCAFDYEALTSYKKAAKLLERAHEVLPDDPNICVWLGDNWYFQKKWKTAQQWYREALRLDEKSFQAWRGLGFALAQAKKWDDAVAALEKAASIDGEDKDLFVTLGDIYLAELNNIDSAIKSYEKYVAKGGDDPDILDLLEELKAEQAGDDDG